MDPLLISFIALVLVAAIFVGLVFKLRSGRNLTQVQRRQFTKQWNAMERIDDPARRVLEADSILDKALIALGYEGSLGDKLKEAGPRFSNVDAVWAAHKLRNHIAHEPGAQVSKGESDRAVERLRRAFDDLC